MRPRPLSHFWENNGEDNHGAKSFFKRCQLLGDSRISQYFVEPEVSLPCSRKPTTGNYPRPDEAGQ
jgi:hypothetical protein